jgi:DNA-binding PadR family transcriptional regulator
VQYIAAKYKYYPSFYIIEKQMRMDTEEETTANWMKEAQKGFIRIGVLILLNKKPSHGYEIMKEIRDRTKGFWKPTPGGVYPILRDLEKSGYIKGEWQTQNNRKLKVYKITESGNLILKRAIVKQNEIANNIGGLFNEFARDVLNIEPGELPIHHMPLPFSHFLEDKKDQEDNITKLKHERKHIRETVKMMQERLTLVDKKISEAKKTEKKKTEKAA